MKKTGSILLALAICLSLVSTAALAYHTVTIIVSSGTGGWGSGGGTVTIGDEVTVRASPDRGYDFDGWYVANSHSDADPLELVSTSPTYTFIASLDFDGCTVNWVFARFKRQESDADTDTGSGNSGSGNSGSDQSDSDGRTWGIITNHYTDGTSGGRGGSVNGDDSVNLTYYTDGYTVKLTAAPNEGYLFDGWYENLVNQGITRISNDKTYTFKANAARTLHAYFITDPDYNPDFWIENGVLLGYKGRDEYVSIPDDVTSIGNNAFHLNQYVGRVAIPDRATSIGTNAFSRCANLTYVSMGSGIRSIGAHAFEDCTGLSGILIMPMGVTTIGSSAFSGCTGLTTIPIPNSVTDIGEWAFSGCTGLTNLTIPASVTSIGAAAFANIPNLQLSVTAGSYAESYARKNSLPYTATGTAAAPPASLSSASEWARDTILAALEAGFVPADLQDNYQDVITRAEFCRMAVKWLEYTSGKSIDTMLSERGLSRDQTAFTDTTDGDILAAFALGITNGTGDGRFSPDGQFNREQAATMIRNTCRAAGMDISDVASAGFQDIDTASPWAIDSINFVRNAGIMQGTGGGNYSPKTSYTREQSIITFYNMN